MSEHDRLDDIIDELNTGRPHSQPEPDSELQRLADVVRRMRALAEPEWPDRSFEDQLVQRVVGHIRPAERRSPWRGLTGFAAVLAAGVTVVVVTVAVRQGIIGKLTHTPPPSLTIAATPSAGPRQLGRGMWSAATPMSSARTGSTATLLLNGKVLFAGGEGPTFGPRPGAAQLYDETTNRWSPAGSMQTGRRYHVAVLLADGRVLVAGGSTDVNGYLATAEIYDPATNSWAATRSMNTARAFAAATLLRDGRVLVVGGSNSSSKPSLATAELYDPTTNSWRNATPMHTGRTGDTATTLRDGHVLVVGGGPPELYDPVNDMWSFAGTMPYADRDEHTATLLLNGRVLVAGGNISTGEIADVEVYDPQTNGWSVAASLPEARNYHSATLLKDGRVLIAGGCCVNFAALLYDPGSNNWSSTGPPVDSSQSPETLTRLHDGRVLAAGGSSQTAAAAAAELYVPSS